MRIAGATTASPGKEIVPHQVFNEWTCTLDNICIHNIKNALMAHVPSNYLKLCMREKVYLKQIVEQVMK